MEFRQIVKSDVDDAYLGWMNDPDVIRYLEIKYPVSREGLLAYWEAHYHSKDEPWFAITVDRVHIGNIKLGPINWIHRSADISLFIGEKEYWGKGHGTQAIKMMVNFAFNTLNLHKVKAGVYQENVASMKAFKKAGFMVCGVLIDDRWCDGKWQNLHILEKINE